MFLSPTSSITGLSPSTFDGNAFTYQDSFTAGFSAPTGLATTPAGEILVADTGNDRIVRLDAAGALLNVYTAPNDGRGGSFAAPRGVAVYPNGVIVVADTGNQRVVNIYPWQVFLPVVLR